MKKLVLLTAVAIGYVLGTRAGRGRYEQIKRQADKVWHADPVQNAAHKAQDTATTTAADVGHRVAETAKDVSSTVTEKVRSTGGKGDDKVSATPEPEASAPSYSTSSEGLRAGAAEADAKSAYDINEAGSDDLASSPNPLSDAKPEKGSPA
ncbi:hypothetical protein AFL01nite_13130 [Aeromicrobium flavum]|uniref:Protoporphyrinogen oxidase n=1 Tax=Aeromicrobium flavum TaxID=416568 RepID=A0A512HU58_9ACTN|nr:hypothetical protein [Aeromicrobium flavum]GEO88986.1 hypothetical protein AFL01nite_13130 [Aeromicrobium flavum]